MTVCVTVARKYTVLQPPYFMTKDVMAGVAQLEQFDEELYKVSRRFSHCSTPPSSLQLQGERGKAGGMVRSSKVENVVAIRPSKLRKSVKVSHEVF